MTGIKLHHNIWRLLKIVINYCQITDFSANGEYYPYTGRPVNRLYNFNLYPSLNIIFRHDIPLWDTKIEPSHDRVIGIPSTLL